jgi:type IV pilus assembly protein PilY1
MLTWDPVGQVGEAFEWGGTGGLTAAQQATLTAGDATSSANRLNYLRGVRSLELTSSGSGTFRARDSVLSDIVDSSPTWVGPPQKSYTLVSSWVDELNPTATQPENASGAQTYAQYMAASSSGDLNGQLSRANVVYVGANDGFLHGFRAGALDINGDLVTTTVPNDGYELLAYMPGAVLNNIHPVTSTGTVIAQLDFSNPQYSHNWYVDATPAQGDVFYNNQWHTWLVSGIGQGGAAIFALDVTNPSLFTEANAQSLVIGEWATTNTTTTNSNGTTSTTTSSNLTCSQQSVTACGVNLGNTYGTPQIRRFHSGQWGFVFGNGYGSVNGASGIYIALLNTSTGNPTFYWYPTSLKFSASTPNGIGYTYAADFDLDNTVDYIYAGDLQGNLWRFDVTSTNPLNWGVSKSSPFFQAGSGQPITTQVEVSTLKTITTTVNAVGLDVSNAPQRVVVTFGTGQQVPQSLNAAASYASGTQALYGVWDWDMAGWNSLSSFQPGIGLTTSPGVITESSMQQQVLTETPGTTVNGVSSGGTATLTHNPVCWDASSTCNGGNTALGWYTLLPSTNEQIIYNPLADPTTGALVFDTYIPSPTGVLSCSPVAATGYSIGMDAGTGEGLTLPLFNVGGASYDGTQTNASGTGSVINAGAAGNGLNYLVTHNANGTVSFTQLNDYTVTTGQRVYWIQKR